MATSSAAAAAAVGKRDGRLTRDEAIAHARLIVDATDLPRPARERGDEAFVQDWPRLDASLGDR